MAATGDRPLDRMQDERMKQIDDILADIETLLDVYRNPGMKQALLTRIRCACEALVGVSVKPDTGPWEVSEDGHIIASDDFDHDVHLKVSGDFYGDEARAAYSRALAARLNGLPKEPPLELLNSMALRYRHDFGLRAEDNDGPISAGVTDAERAAILRVMRQLYEEVAGHGFYRW